MRSVLLVCDRVEEINRLRRLFDSNVIIKAVNSIDGAVANAAQSMPDLILYYVGTAFRELFRFYNSLQSNPMTAMMPLVVLADRAVMKMLDENVAFHSTTILPIDIQKDEFSRALDDAMDSADM